MFRKTYSVDAIEWKGLFMINGALTPITFSGGKQGNGRRIKARFSTSDVNIQKAIESDQRYSKTVFFEVAYRNPKMKNRKRYQVKKCTTATSYRRPLMCLSQNTEKSLQLLQTRLRY